MFIKDELIQLRGAEPEDAYCIYNWENDMSIWRVSETYTPYTLFQIEQFLLNNNDLFSTRQLRLIIENIEKQPIGSIDIFDYDPIHQRAGIGILVDKQYRQQGYAEHACKLLIDYLFETLMLKQVYCLIEIDNLASQKLFSKIGFAQCGLRKQWIKTPNGFIDQLEYQFINIKY